MAESKVTPITASKDQQIQTPRAKLSAYSALVSRAMLMSRLGYEYGGDRNLYEALGYKRILYYEDFVAQYERQELAKAVIDRPVNATWRGGFTLLESDDAQQTPLEEAWAKLYDRLKLRQVFARLDKLTGLGRYGVLFLGLSDAKQPADQGQPIQGVKHDLLYVKPFGEEHARILEYETNSSDPRYGLPKIYQLTSTDLLSHTMTTLRVHYSRVIHVVDGALESDIEGTPRLEAVFNRLKDVEKIAGGSSEMFWRGARPGYQFKLDPEFTMTAPAKEAMEDGFDEYEHNLRRILEIEGGELKTLAAQVEDPEKHIDVQIQLISAEKCIPKRILTGSEVGELASSQDLESWNSYIRGRQEEFAEQGVIRPFTDRLLEIQTLPPAGGQGYSVKWPTDPTTPKDQVEMGKGRSAALKDYAGTPGAAGILSRKTFLRVGLALSEDEISLNEQELEQDLLDEQAMRKQLEAQGGTQGQPPTGPQPPASQPGPGGQVPANPRQAGPTTQSNPCHNPAGPGGGQFCSGGEGGGSGASGGVEWKASMTRAEANEWSKNSVYKEKIYHGTGAAGAEGISSNGFDKNKMESYTQGAMYGTGFYFTENKGFATRYAREGTKPLEIRLNVKKVCYFPEFTKLMNDHKEALNKAMMSTDLTARAKLITKIVRGAGYDALSLKYAHGHHELVVYEKKNITVVRGR